MVLIERSVETPRSPSIAARSLQGRPQGGLVGVPTSKRPQINNAQYLGIPSEILKSARVKKSSIVVETNDDEAGGNNVDLERVECRDIQISCIDAKSLAETLEACRP
jgi:hypothetical protein